MILLGLASTFIGVFFPNSENDIPAQARRGVGTRRPSGFALPNARHICQDRVERKNAEIVRTFLVNASVIEVDDNLVANSITCVALTCDPCDCRDCPAHWIVAKRIVTQR